MAVLPARWRTRAATCSAVAGLIAACVLIPATAASAAVEPVNGITQAGTSAFTNPPNITVSDNFTRANSSTLGSNWNPVRGVWSINSNTAVPDTTLDALDLNTQYQLGSAYTVSTQVSFTQTTGGTWAGLVFGSKDDATDRYEFRIAPWPGYGGWAWQVLRRTLGNSSPTGMGMGLFTSPISVNTPYTMTAQVDMTKLNVSVTAPGSTTNLIPQTGSGGASGSTITLESCTPASCLPLIGGRAGLYGNTGGAAFSNFSVSTRTDTPRVVRDTFDTGTDLSSTWSGGGTGWSNAGVLQAPFNTVLGSEYDLEQEHVDLSGAEFSTQADINVPATSQLTPHSDAWNGAWNGLQVNESVVPGAGVTDATGQTKGARQYYQIQVNAQDGEWRIWRNQAADGGAQSATMLASSLNQGGTPLPLLTITPGSTYIMRVDSSGPGVFTVQILQKNSDGTSTVIGSTAINDPTPLRGGMVRIFSDHGDVSFDNFQLLSSDSMGSPQILSKTSVATVLAHAPSGQSMLTNGNDQYVGYYATDRHVVIAARKLDGSAPQCTTTSTATATILSVSLANGWCSTKTQYRVNDDTHNYITMALDSAGQLHAVGNVKTGPATLSPDTTSLDSPTVERTNGFYLRTTTAGNVSSLQAQNFGMAMDPTPHPNPQNSTQLIYNEFVHPLPAGYPTNLPASSMAYPQFYKQPNGSLILRYVNGGNLFNDDPTTTVGCSYDKFCTYLAKYDTSSQTWSSLYNPGTTTMSPLFTSTSSTATTYNASGGRSEYATAFTKGPDGVYRMAWVWADDTTLSGREHVSYVQSTDLQNWTTVTGAPVTLPINYDTPGVLVDNTGTSMGLIQPNAGTNGEATPAPVITYTRATGAGGTMQAFAAVYRNGQWTITQLTHGNDTTIPSGLNTASATAVSVSAATPYGPKQPTWVTLGYSYQTGQGRMIFDTATNQVIADLPGQATNAQNIPSGNTPAWSPDLGTPTDGTVSELFWPSWPQILSDAPKNAQGGSVQCPGSTASAPECTNPDTSQNTLLATSANPQPLTILKTQP